MSDSTLHTPESLLDHIALVYDNIVFERSGDAWVFLELATDTYDMLSTQTKRDRHSKLISALCGIPAPGRGKFIITRQDFDRESYIRQRRAVNPSSKIYQKWVSNVDSALLGDRGSRKKVHLAVRLYQDLYPSLGRGARQTLREAEVIFRQRVLGSPSPVPDAEIERARMAAKDVESIFGPLLAPPREDGSSSRPTPLDVARLIRHLFQRGIPHDEVPSIGTLWERGEDSRVLIPNPQAWRALVSDITIESQFSQLAFYHGQGSITFQRFLGLSQMPTSALGFPGSEYAHPAEPSDILLDFDLTPYYEAERKRESKEQRLAGQEDHIRTAGGTIDMGMADARAAHREMEATYRSGLPRIALHASYCVAADSIEELNQKSKDLKNELKKQRVTLTQPRGKHLQAFADYLPVGAGVGDRNLSSYQVPMPPVTLAGSAPYADDFVGDDQGSFLGITHRSASPVFFDPTTAMTDDKNSAVALIGSQGSGKSVTMYNIFAQLCLQGYWQILLDPKGDAKNIANLSELSGALHEVFIDPASEMALPILKLYPFPEIDKTWRILRDFLVQLFGAQEGLTELQQDKIDATRLATHEFMRWFENSGGNTSITKLKAAFYTVGQQNHASTEGANTVDTGKLAQTANRLAYLLDTFSEKELSSIVLADEGDVFGSTTGEGIATGDPRSIIFYTHRLQLQDAEARANGIPPSEEERMAQAVMSVVNAAAYELAGKQRFKKNDEKTFRAVHVDEAWQILLNQIGKNLMNFLLRAARSQWVGSFLASQKWSDVKDMKDHLGAVFLGKNPSDDDIKAALAYMGVTPSTKTISNIQGYTGGNFVFKDVDDNVAPIYVQPTPDRWRRQLDTSPGNTRRKDADNAVSTGQLETVATG